MATYEKAPHTPTYQSSSSILKGDIEVQSPVDDLRFQDEKMKVTEEPLDRSTPTRKYSVHWWKRTWNGAVRVGKWPRIIYCVVGLIFIAVWIACMLSLVGAEVNHEKQANEGKSHRAGTNGDDTGAVDMILLQGSLVNFNIEKRALTVSWSGLYAMNNETEPVVMGNWTDENSYVAPYGIAIYRDISADLFNLTYSWTEEDTNTTHLDWGYTWKLDNATAIPSGVIGMHTWDSFETDITFAQRFQKNAWFQPLLGYPFDQWEGKITFVAKDLLIANLTTTTAAGAFGLSGVRLADSTLNWRFNYEFKDVCFVPEAANWTNGTGLPEHCYLEVTLWGTRPPLLIFCAIAAVFVNWTCALFIFVLTCEAIVMRRSYMLRGTDILSMCFTALFALPTIRALLPGAPAYGAIIDLVGILPCTLIVALCAVCVAVAKLNKRSKDQKFE